MPLVVLGLIILTALLLSGCAQGLMPSSWPGITVDEESGTAYVSAGLQIFALDLENGTERWHFPEKARANRSFYAAPLLTEEGQLIVGGYDHVLYSLNPANGELKWEFRGARNHYIANPQSANSLIYAPNADYRLYVLDLKGNLRWSFKADQALWASPLIENEVLYLTSLDRKVYALNALTGEKIWEKKLDAAILTSPVSAEGKPLFVAAFNGLLYALNKENGEILWQAFLGNRLWAAPLLVEDTLYIGDQEGTFHAFDTISRKDIWQMETRSAILGIPLLYNDGLAFGTENGTLYTTTLSGTPHWQQIVHGKLYGSAVAAGDLILVAPVDGDYALVALTSSGAQKWAFRPGR